MDDDKQPCGSRVLEPSFDLSITFSMIIVVSSFGKDSGCGLLGSLLKHLLVVHVTIFANQ